ncbi:MAG: gliding motility-associated C-terminal domain-containing protein, partial [Saprospiraceae bacterium]
IQVIDYPITATSGSMLLEDFIPSPAIDISAIESEEMFVSFDALCTVNAPCIEICDNGIDDDDNGLIDCSDLSCPCNTCLNKADLVLSSIDSIRCIGNEYMATLTICNKGDKDFNGSVPVTFYNGNPWGKSVSALSTSLQFVGSLEKDSCAQVTYRFTKYRDGDIYAVINAGENLVTPYDENTFFDDVDCNLTNNTKSILFAPSIPTLDLGPDVEICRGQVVNLSAQEGFSSYNWQDFNPNKNYTAFTQGLYAVTVSDYCGNTQKDEIHIKEKKLVPIQLGEDKLICQGTSLEINLNPPANGKFVWDDGIEGAYRKLNSSGSYTLGFYTPENCVVKDTIEVVVIPAPVLSIEDSISICEGSTYTVVLADIDMKYNWYDGDTSSTKVFNQAGIYSVSASNEACTVQDSIQIDIINKPQINLPDSLSFCTGDSIRLSVQPQQSASYFWNTGEQTPDIVVKNSGTYILEANIKNCTSSDTVLVQEFFRPEISLQPIITACQGDTIALNVNINPDQTILWSNGNTTNSTLISESGTYTVQISNKSCIASDTSEVTFFEKPIANLAEQLHGCEGKILQLELSVKPMEEIIWYDGTKDTLKQFDKSGLYSLTIKNEHCATLDTVQVTFHELPESFDLGKDTTLCDDLQLHINVTKNENYLYEWNDGVSSASRNISETGLYSLKVENRYGCIEADSIQVIFVPQPEFSLGMDTSICKGDSFNINLILPENSIITWNDQSMERNRTLFNPGLYTATLDYYGCQTSDDIEIYVNDCNPFEIYLPNVFRYNSAVNGLFKPVINGDTYSISDYIMTIFDRWGNLVFKSSDPEIGWDGTYLGQPSESGVYIYILNVVFKDHSEPIRLEKQGSITLLK